MTAARMDWRELSEGVSETAVAIRRAARETGWSGALAAAWADIASGRPSSAVLARLRARRDPISADLPAGGRP